jgi:SHAQKYF class myb-like DNA-binding protein
MMYHAKNFSVPFAPQRAQNNDHANNIGAIGGSNISNPANPVGSGKQRLRWTSDLHNRFVDAIAQLGGPDSGYSILCRVFVIVVELDALHKQPYAQMFCADGIK